MLLSTIPIPLLHFVGRQNMSKCNSKKEKTKKIREEELLIKRIRMYVNIFVGTPKKINIFRYEQGYLARITFKMAHKYKSKKTYYMHHYICFNEYSDIRDFYMLCEQNLIQKFNSQYEPSSITKSKIHFLNAITHDYLLSYKDRKPRQHFILFPCALKKIQHYVFEEPRYIDSIVMYCPLKSCII